MLKKNWVRRDNTNRNKYNYTETNKIVLKSLLANNKFDKASKIYWSYLFNKFGKNHSISYYRNNCNILNTGRSVFKNFKACRHIIKKYASLGHLPGVRKSSF